DRAGAPPAHAHDRAARGAASVRGARVGPFCQQPGGHRGADHAASEGSQAHDGARGWAPRRHARARRRALRSRRPGARPDRGRATSCRRSPKRPPMRLCLLNATPCSILASSLRMSDSGVVRLLLFRVGTLVCAAEAERVREILPRLAPTRIPGAPPVVAGLVNVRGTLVTAVAGWRALRPPEPPGDAGPAPPPVLQAGG